MTVRRHPRVEWIGGPLRHAIVRQDGVLSARSLCGLKTSDILDQGWADKPLDVCSACRGVLKRHDRVAFVR